VRASSIPVTAKEFDELGELFRLIPFVAALDCVGDAVRGVILENELFDFLESRFDSLNLIENVDAIAVFLDHARDAAHLSFDSRDATDQLRVGFGLAFGQIDSALYTLQGYRISRRCQKQVCAMGADE
jgi:hypothetical protein